MSFWHRGGARTSHDFLCVGGAVKLHLAMIYSCLASSYYSSADVLFCLICVA